jgi:hypothetical protein
MHLISFCARSGVEAALPVLAFLKSNVAFG